jgi:hypothetical protein
MKMSQLVIYSTWVSELKKECKFDSSYKKHHLFAENTN